MEEPAFPAFRELGNGLSRYRIDSATAMVEVQRIGRRYMVHRLEASTYPERLRINELLMLADAEVKAIDHAAFDDWWALAVT
jgi:hypothetical protein